MGSSFALFLDIHQIISRQVFLDHVVTIPADKKKVYVSLFLSENTNTDSKLFPKDGYMKE